MPCDMDARDFALKLQEYSGEFLRGAVEIEITGNDNGKINVCTAYAAYALRGLISVAREDELLKVNINLDEFFTMSVTFMESPESEPLVKTYELAKMAGFKVRRTENTVFFYMPIKISAVFSLYAVSRPGLKNEFFEIMFCE